MILNRLLFISLIVFVFSSFTNKELKNALYKNPSASIEDRVEDLLKRMTLNEKTAQTLCYGIDKMMVGNRYDTAKLNKILQHGIGQLRDHNKVDVATSVQLHNDVQKYLIENTRLGIPAIIHGEGLHGYVNHHATSFPQALALAGTWNLELINKVYAHVAKETRSRGVQQLLTPVLDIARYPRWGRFSETFGEDPVLTAEIGKQVVSSFQGEGDAFLNAEHIQLYIHDFIASVTRPMKELKAFKRVEIKAGETKTVNLTLKAKDLAFYNKEMERVTEPGIFKIMVGSSSKDEDLLKTNLFVSEK